MTHQKPQERIRALHEQTKKSRGSTGLDSDKSKRQALEQVYGALNSLVDNSETDIYIDVLTKASAGRRALGALSSPRLRVPGAPFTISEYMTGENNAATRQRKLHVARTAAGWLLPRMIMVPGASNPEVRVAQADPSMPNMRPVVNLVFSPDGRSWQNGRIATPTLDTDMLTVGVLRDEGNNPHNRGVESYSVGELALVHDALYYMAENPLRPKSE